MRCVLSILFIFNSLFLISQKSSKLYEEFNISFNRTVLKDINTRNGSGYGFSYLHVLLNEKRVFLLVGLEYNRTSQLKLKLYDGLFAKAVNTSFTIHSLTIPLILRVNVGKKERLFFDVSPFIDFALYARGRGVKYVYEQDTNSVIQKNSFPVSEKISFNNLLGFSVGVGYVFPIGKTELSLRGDYRGGFNYLYNNYDSFSKTYFRISLGYRLAR